MAFPYWAINESKRRQIDPDWGQMPVYEVSIKYLDWKGKARYKFVNLSSEGELSLNLLAKLVKDIEDECFDEVKKSGDGWFKSDMTL
jgi:hypothetical protein